MSEKWGGVILVVVLAPLFLVPITLFGWWAITDQSLVAHPFWLGAGCLLVGGAIMETVQ